LTAQVSIEQQLLKTQVALAPARMTTDVSHQLPRSATSIARQEQLKTAMLPEIKDARRPRRLHHQPANHNVTITFTASEVIASSQARQQRLARQLWQ
jgi:hypothetical protein